mmetsp:Transcript_20795/g.59333  ORF Transcript_20795/g.59333 Transcript_20795/m.59333 type:complete len:224 (+) Transcript_20795:221-892(+)
MGQRHSTSQLSRSFARSIPSPLTQPSLNFHSQSPPTQQRTLTAAQRLPTEIATNPQANTPIPQTPISPRLLRPLNSKRRPPLLQLTHDGGRQLSRRHHPPQHPFCPLPQRPCQLFWWLVFLPRHTCGRRKVRELVGIATGTVGHEAEQPLLAGKDDDLGQNGVVLNHQAVEWDGGLRGIRQHEGLRLVAPHFGHCIHQTINVRRDTFLAQRGAEPPQRWVKVE